MGWRDQAGSTLLRGCPPCRPMADNSSFMPLRRAPHRPDPASLECASCVNAVRCHGDLIGFLSRKTDAFHLVSEQLAQLVFRGNHGERLARVSEARKNRRRA